jgi:hypothetical protein
MTVSNKEVRRRMVEETISTEGWGILMEEATFQMNQVKDKLLTTPPEDVIGVTRLQTQYKTLDRIINIAYGIAKEG